MTLNRASYTGLNIRNSTPPTPSNSGGNGGATAAEISEMKAIKVCKPTEVSADFYRLYLFNTSIRAS